MLELARSMVYFGPRQLERWAAAHGAHPVPGVEPTLSHLPHLAAKGFIDDRYFFRRLGFDEVVSCDVSDYEGVDVVADLNLELPAELVGRFDVVFEAGTAQHVFDLPSVLSNVHRALKVGGRAVVGMACSNNHVDHGFYMFSPTVFYDYFAANRWQIDSFYFFEFLPYWFDGVLYSPPWRIYRYQPGCLDHLSYGGYGSAQMAIFCVATRTAETTGDRTPQQGYYQRMWEDADLSRLAERTGPGGVERRLGRLSEKSALVLAAARGWKLVRQRVVRRLPRRMPPLFARY